MKAVVFEQHGGPEVLQYREDVPEPTAGSFEVRVRVRAASVNYLDVWTRKGLPYTIAMPHILGNDGAGVIDQVGPGVTHLNVGDEVVLSPGAGCNHCRACLDGDDMLCLSYDLFGLRKQGTYAEFVVAPARNAFPKPSQLSFEEAASMPLVFLTAWHMLVTRAQVRPGEFVLILAAASGVGTAAVQIAKLCGAYVIAAASTEEKLRRVRELGADATVNYRERDFAGVARELTGGRGLDCVVETVGKDTWAKSLHSLRRGGRVVTCGTTSGAFVEQDIRYLYRQHLSILGSSMGTHREMRSILDLIGQGKLRPVIHSVLPLREAAEAHRTLAARAQFGKVLLVPSTTGYRPCCRCASARAGGP